MASLSTLSTLALMIVSGAVAAPWNPTSRYHTHRSRGVGPTGVQLSTYHPPSVFEGYGVTGIDHPLAKRGIKSATPEEAAKNFLQDKFGIPSGELTRHSGYTFDDVSYEYFTQNINGMPISNAVANVALKGDKVMSYGASFIKPKHVAAAIPLLSDIQAISLAEKAIGGDYNKWPTSLKYFAKDNDHVVLVHVVQIQNMHSGDWKQAYINTEDGKLVNVVDFVANSSYTVIPIENQDPSTGFKDISNPEDKKASPDGWHKSRGVETYETSGNNAVAYKGIDQNILPLSIPIFDRLFKLLLEPSKPPISSATVQSSPDNVYEYKYDDSKDPAQNVDPARVNAFYVVNSIHDLVHPYGFQETSFNFQNDNFGKGGKGDDRVQISVQDPSGTNNANFATPPDGQNGQMRMFTWTFTTPQRDGALENDIVTHEMTHGISNRMTGGGTAACLQTTEAGGMGEGWSDAMADILESLSSAKSEQLNGSNKLPDFTLGSYVTNKPAGIRSHPYSTNKDTNPLMYSSVAKENEVHNIGEVWANMLHNVYAQLVEQYGFGTIDHLKDPSQEYGANYMMHYILDGFAQQPCNPTFPQARDAIIQADATRFGGKNKCLIWRAFASRGLGGGAMNYVDSMKVPDGC